VTIGFDKGIFKHFALLVRDFRDPLLDAGLNPAGKGLPVFFFLLGGHNFSGKFVQLLESSVFFPTCGAAIQMHFDLVPECRIQFTIKVATQKTFDFFVAHLLPPRKYSDISLLSF
jgi:hypothetical protein